SRITIMNRDSNNVEIGSEEWWTHLYESLCPLTDDADLPISNRMMAIDDFVARFTDENDRYWLAEIKRANVFFDEIESEIIEIANQLPVGTSPHRMRDYLWDSLLIRIKHNSTIAKKVERMFTRFSGVSLED